MTDFFAGGERLARGADWTRGLIACALGLVLVAATPAGAQEPTGIETYRGQQGPKISRAHVARNNDEWTALWALVDQRPPRPLVDGEETGIAVFAGERPTGGYRIDVGEPSQGKDTLTLDVTIVAPKELATQAITAPYVYVIVKATAPDTTLTLSGPLTPPPAPEQREGALRNSSASGR